MDFYDIDINIGFFMSANLLLVIFFFNIYLEIKKRLYHDSFDQKYQMYSINIPLSNTKWRVDENLINYMDLY